MKIFVIIIALLWIGILAFTVFYTVFALLREKITGHKANLSLMYNLWLYGVTGFTLLVFIIVMCIGVTRYRFTLM